MDSERLLDLRDSTTERIKKLASIEGSIETLVVYVFISFFSLLFLISVVVGTWSVHVTSSKKGTLPCIENENAWRLPDSVYPVHYKLDLQPSIKHFNFTGQVEMALDVKQPTLCLLFHKEDLNVWDIVLWQNITTGAGEDEVVVLDLHSVEHGNVTNVMKIGLSEKLQVGGSYHLRMSFSGMLRNDLRGFYHSHYVSASGREQWIATTQFEPESARTAFPCFDEPKFKAELSLSITLPPEDTEKTVMANMPEKEREKLPDGSIKLQFERSMKLSTYLIAYIIGDFDYVEAINTAGSKTIRYRVYTMPGESHRATFALQAAQNIARYFTDFFAIDYELSKMDLVAIPDFRAGAMENWGLITFRDTALLFDEDSSAIKDMQYVATVVAHEISHQWTGNLVTTSWWSELWLNEGFATFFEALSVDSLYPDWKHWEFFLVDTVQPLLQSDALPGTHSLVVSPPVNDSQQIEGMFDNISYNKGGSLLRMLYNYLGMETFRRWMRQYYDKYQFQNTVTNDLLDELANVDGSNIDISNMKQWTQNPGYPVLHLVRTASNEFRFRQERFFSGPPTEEQKAGDEHWWIPVTLFDSEGNEQDFIFQSRDSPAFKVVDQASWIKANKKNTGIFRINYTPDMWSRLSRAMEKEHALLKPISERFGLVDDAFALGMAGYSPLYLALDMARALQRQTSHVIWSAIANNLISISRIITLESYRGMFYKYVCDLVKVKLDELGWDPQPGETQDRSQLRPLLISLASQFGNDSVVQEANNRYALMENDPILHSIPSDMRAAVYDTVVRYGSDSEYNSMLSRFRKAVNDVSERNRCIYALTVAQLPHLIKHNLEMTMTDEIRNQDGIFVLRSIARSSPLALSMTWDFIREHFDDIVSKYGMRTVNTRLITGVASLYVSEWKKREVVEFFSTKDDISEQFLQMAEQQIDANIRFLQTNREELSKWLEEHAKDL